MGNHIKKFNEELRPGEVDIARAMENRKISELTVREFKEIVKSIVAIELAKRT